MKPTYERGPVRLYLANCRDVLPTLAGIDAVVTDPPYGVGLDYNASFQDDAEYWATLATIVLPECLRIASGPILWFGAALTIKRDLMTFPVAPERVLIWNPAFSLSKTGKNGMLYRWHPIYCWRLLKTRNPGCPNFDVLRDSCDGHNWWNHPGTKPVSVMLSALALTPIAGTVLDPFAGSGTTGVAAVESGRGFVGCEVKPEYFALAVRRIDAALDQGRLPFQVSDSAP